MAENTPQSRQGQFIQADFFDNSTGLNLTDSPFRVHDGQATGGYNYEYTVTGGIRKRNAHPLANSSPDAQARSLGFGLHVTPTNVRTMLRAGGRKVQTLNPTTFAASNVAEDTQAAGTDFFANGTTMPVCFNQYNTTLADVVWMAGGGLSTLTGYTGSKVTTNGAAAPTGAISLSQAGGSGVFPVTGDYYYAVQLRKASTQALSNAALDVVIAVSATTNDVTVNLTGLTGLDTTKYDQIWIYRSPVSGVSAFTTGDLIAQVASTATSYVDNGDYLASPVNVPRSGNTILDNSPLPAGTYNTQTVWKRRLITASGSTLYLSDVNKPESWPAGNNFTLPSGGSITALGIVSFTTPTTLANDEYLVVFKERELWVVTGDSVDNWALKLIDTTGCVGQNLLVAGNGFLAFIDYRGVYLWDGAAKPIYCSRPIEQLFQSDGDLDRANLPLGSGAFYRKTNQMVWFLSSSSLGINKYALKLDLRLTLPLIQATFAGRVLEGVFIQDKTPFPIHGCASILPTYDELFIGGDASGNIYKLLYDGTVDGASTGVDWSYQTKALDLGQKGIIKRVHKVIVYLRDTSENKLTLGYWTNYRSDVGSKASQREQITHAVTNAVWDQGYWDSAYWDQNLVTYNPVVFNLSGSTGTTEGDVITLEFSNSDPNTPVTIAGFSIIYSLGAMRK